MSARPSPAASVAALFLAVLGLILGMACAYPYTSAIDEREIRQVTTAYIKDVASDDGAGAYGLLSPAIRQRCSKVAFEAELASISGRITGSEPESKVDDIEIDGETARAKLVLNELEVEDPVIYQYVKLGPRWYLEPPNFTC